MKDPEDDVVFVIFGIIAVFYAGSFVMALLFAPWFVAASMVLPIVIAQVVWIARDAK